MVVVLGVQVQTGLRGERGHWNGARYDEGVGMGAAGRAGCLLGAEVRCFGARCGQGVSYSCG